MARKQYTMEDNFDKVMEKVQEAPKWALATVGRELVKEIRPNITRKNFGANRAFLRATLQSWARQREGDLIIGFKDPERISFLKNVKAPIHTYKWHYDQVQDPIKPAVMNNIERIKQLTAEGIMATESKKGANNLYKAKDIDYNG